MWQTTQITWPQSADRLQSRAETVIGQVGSVMNASTECLITLQSDASFGRHPLSAEAQGLINLRDKLNSLLSQGTTLSVTPYQFQVGEKLDSGCYLSPASAVKTLAAKLRDLSDAHRPKERLYAVGVMLTAQSLDEFASKLQEITRVLRLPDWCQCARQAKALTRTQDKLYQPTAILQPRFKPFAMLTANPLNEYAAQQSAHIATLESLASDGTHVIDKLNALAVKRTDRMAEITQAINAMKELSGNVYSMAMSGTPASIATLLVQAELPNNHPLVIASLLISDRPLVFFEDLLC